MPFPHLFQPIHIGSLKSKNRLLMSAMSINFGVDDKGHVTEQLIQYMVARAEGGVGMMLVGGAGCTPPAWNCLIFPPCGRMTASPA